MMHRLSLFSWLDVRLGLRLIRKHPLLNLAAIFALAVGIPIGLAPSHLSRALAAPLPGDSDNRVRAIRYWDPAASGTAPTLDDDFAHWARSLSGFSALAAFRTTAVNVATLDGPSVSVSGALMTADAFALTATRATIGRVLDARDYEPGAPDVVVIGHGLWASHFGRDPNVLGRRIRVGRVVHEVVGVMPDGFAFPANESLWFPLRPTPEEHARVQIVGRLAPGVSAEQAQAELSLLAPPPLTRAASAGELEARARLRAEVVPFGLLYLGLPAGGLSALPEFGLVQALTIVLLLVACGNVAMLVFARTATRLRELAIRTALGASRARIVGQIFVETVILAVVGAGVGIAAVDAALGRVNLAALAGENALPYWLSLDLTLETVLGALGLALLSATVAGAVPAVAITGRRIFQNIQGGARVRFGRLTGALVIADIAVSVAAVGMAFAVAGHATDVRAANLATGIPASEYLAVEIRLPLGDETAANQRELVAALEREPGVRRVAVGDALPRMEHRSRPFEVDNGLRAAETRLRWVRQATVDVDYLRALAVPVLRGRDFVPSDAEGRARVAIVNTVFAEREFADGDALGRRVRFPSTTDSTDTAWYEIIGVVGHIGVNVLNPDRGEAVYLAAAPGSINPAQVAIHTVGAPTSMIGRVREVAQAVNPEIVIGRAVALSELRQGDWYLVMGVAIGMVTLAGVLVALATSGLYAMLSLAVTERTREIGIRAALGASRTALLRTVLRKSVVQIGIGALIGLPLATRFAYELLSNADGGGSVLTALATAVGLSLGIVLLVGIGSCLAPTRRILATDASEAMRAGD
jgi:putative ABC transport system permease protein